MNFTGVWWYFLIIGIFVVFSALLLRFVPFYKNIIGPDEGGRFESLDGLRGFLALNVFFQHAVTNYFYFQTGVWQIVPIKFYRYLGGEAVILFFLITSFLYWSKAINQKGELNVASLYRSRFLRLAPMYGFSAGVIVVFALLQSYTVDLWRTAADILSWLSLGLITTTSFNHISILPINAGVHWTLGFEWWFYLMLPVFAVALKSKKALFMVLPLALFVLLSPYRGYWAIFFFGIIAAHIYKKYPRVAFFNRSISSLVPIVGILIVYFMNYKPYSIPQYVVFLAVFLSFVYGADLFGLLKTKVAKFLGTISYSIYLLHGIVLFVVLNSVNHFYPIAQLSPIVFWSLILLSGLLVILVSAVTYHYIEYPFIKMIKATRKEPAKVAIIDQVM